MRLLVFIAFMAGLALTPVDSLATHLKAGEIQVRRLSCNWQTFEITLVIYTNIKGTSVRVGGSESDILSFGDGTTMLIPETQPTEILDSNLGIAKVVIKINHTYAKPGRYLISYVEPNRNEGLLNVKSSAQSLFEIETMILVEEGVCNTTATFLSPPIDKACQRTAYYHNPVAFDADNDSLSYELAIPKRDNTNTFADYLLPNDPSFYDKAGVQYNQGNEARNGPPSFRIDPQLGLLVWDAPGATGNYLVAIKLREWKKNIYGFWYEASYTIRDMEISVVNCDDEQNTAPSIDAPSEICEIAEKPVEFNLNVSDADKDSVTVDVYSEFQQLFPEKYKVTPAENLTKAVAAPLSFTVFIETSCEQVRLRPYFLTIKVTDLRKGARKLSRFFSVSIKIIGPAPIIETVSVNPISKSISLSWKTTPCENIQSFQVWRKIAKSDYEQPACETGLPSFLRYQLIATLPKNQKTFRDDNLDIGSQYCYRIISLVGGDNIQGRISIDTCLIPKPAEAPVITNVSVQTTDTENGKVLVRWTSPFEIDQTQYPPPYQYRVIRKNETLATSFENISGLIADTSFVDQSLNTEKYVYRYFVELFVPSLSTTALDSSSEASSISLKTISTVDEIILQWQAETPWSNYSVKKPFHTILRSTSKDGPFTIIDSVNVNFKGFAFTDHGQYKNEELWREPYYYKVLTRGTYGNTKVNEPLENYSPIVRGQLLDTIPPCQPIAEIENIPCSQFSCDGKSYYSILHWAPPDGDCADDVVAYEVFAKHDSSSVYFSLGTVTKNQFRHDGLSSLDYCYRIIGIDHVGNRSDTIASICNTSCLAFKLPNVITPGLADNRNDLLSAYDETNASNDDCARSVKAVQFSVFTRWGDEIFVKRIEGMEPLIFWPGTTQAGTEVAAGVYFYKAKVSFQTNDVAKKQQSFQGWVQVFR